MTTPLIRPKDFPDGTVQSRHILPVPNIYWSPAVFSTSVVGWTGVIWGSFYIDTHSAMIVSRMQFTISHSVASAQYGLALDLYDGPGWPGSGFLLTTSGAPSTLLRLPSTSGVNGRVSISWPGLGFTKSFSDPSKIVSWELWVYNATAGTITVVESGNNGWNQIGFMTLGV